MSSGTGIFVCTKSTVRSVTTTSTSGLRLYGDKKPGDPLTARSATSVANPELCRPAPNPVNISELLARARTLQAMKRNQEAHQLLISAFKLTAGDLEGGVPCHNHEVNLALVHFWWSVNECASAQRLLIATFQQECGDPQSGRPCKNPETNLLLAQHCLHTGKLDPLVKLAIATPTTGGDVKPVRQVIHFMRHAQGHHNLAARTDPENWYLRDDLLDPHITETGKKQCAAFAQSIGQHLGNTQLVVVSPMNRTIQTAAHSLPHLVNNNTQWIALESVRERVGLHSCDQRMPVSAHQANYHYVNFDQITFDDDMLKAAYQHNQTREPAEHLIQRCTELIKWLTTRPEKEIVVVSHGHFLLHLFSVVLTEPLPGSNTVTIRHHADCEQPMKPVKPFRNCEIRSLVLDTFPA